MQGTPAVGDEEMRALLRQGAALLSARACVQRFQLMVWQGPNDLLGCAEWGALPGVVSVFSKDRGDLFARSRPGEPLTLDLAVRSDCEESMTRGERTAALAAASIRLKESVNPVLVVLPQLCGPFGGRNASCEASWIWPGLVRIVNRLTGETIAESQPGRPGELAPRQDWR